MENITVVIPARNEERTVRGVIRGVRKELPKARIIVVDDGSTDGTSRICRKEKVEVITHKRTEGLGRSMKEGLEKAEGDVIMIDADGEYSPGDIGGLLDGLKRQDVVLGSRFLGKRPRMGMTHKLGNILFSGLVSSLIGQRITDAQTGLRALNGKATKKIKLSGGYTYTQEMILLAAKSGLRIGEVPARYQKRRYGQSRIAKNPFAYGMKVLPLILKSALRKPN